MKSSSTDYATEWSNWSRVGFINISYTNWTGEGPWSQVVTFTNETITSNTMVNLRANTTTLAQLQENDITEIIAENNAGEVTIYCRGLRVPKADITLQYSLIDVSKTGNGIVIGDPVVVGLLYYTEFDYHDDDLVPNATNVGDVSIMNGMISNGWVLMSLDFTAKVALTSGTQYKIAELSTALYNKIGRTYRAIGVIETAKNVAAGVLVDTWNTDENDVPTKSIYFTPSTAYAKNAYITFTIIFPVSYNI